MRPGALVLASVLAVGGCESPPGPEAGGEHTAQAVMVVSQIPRDVYCIELRIDGRVRVEKRFEVKPGSPAELAVFGLPAGPASVSANAFRWICSALPPASMPVWSGGPVDATFEAGRQTMVRLVLQRQGAIEPDAGNTVDAAPSAGADASPDATADRPTDASPDSPLSPPMPDAGADSPSDTEASVDAWVPPDASPPVEAAAGPCPGGMVTFADEEFFLSDWQTTVAETTDPALTFTTSRETSGGNPGAYSNTVLTIGGSAHLSVLHLRKSATYAPALQGPIKSMKLDIQVAWTKFTYDLRQAAAAIAVVQGGVLFATTEFYVESYAGWRTQPTTSERDFVRVGKTGPERPDFSETGAALQFGFLVSGQRPSWQSTAEGFVGVDNWRIEICRP